MTPLRQRMLEDMQLRGLAARTQESYLRAVEQLAKHYRKSPELVTEASGVHFCLVVLTNHAPSYPVFGLLSPGPHSARL